MLAGYIICAALSIYPSHITLMFYGGTPTLSFTINWPKLVNCIIVFLIPISTLLLSLLPNTHCNYSASYLKFQKCMNGGFMAIFRNVYSQSTIPVNQRVGTGKSRIATSNTKCKSHPKTVCRYCYLNHASIKYALTLTYVAKCGSIYSIKEICYINIFDIL